VTIHAIGDIQGCYDELRTLVAQLGFKPDRDQLWFTGDLVNRGPRSVETLRYVRSLGDNAVTVLGNHDLHLLAVAFASKRNIKSRDTIQDVLGARDKDALLECCCRARLLIRPRARTCWCMPVSSPVEPAPPCAGAEAALKKDPRAVFDEMYGNQPDQWSDSLQGMDRLRFAINALTRLRVCTREGRIDLKMKGGAQDIKPPWKPWFEWDNRESRNVRVIFGHWSALGLVRTQGVVGLDTGWVWGRTLTALDLDAEDAKPVSTACRGYQEVSE
jgi:bis(5'-nucleosyl)-tetraphosphatase (symmetrical)